MYVYTPGQWALLFFFYCFCGWVWESCYVSAKQRHWAVSYTHLTLPTT